jgi:hypothetical protein
MTEQLRLDQLARDRRHVDGDERPVAALAVFMQRAGDELLASAGLARDHHGQIGLREAGEHAVDVLHRGTAADERQAFARLCREPLGPFARLGERAAHHRDEFVEVEGLGQIFVSAALGRGDRGHEGVLRAHHDDGEIGPKLLHPRNEVEGALVGHQHVGDDEVALPLADPAPQRRGIAGRARCVAGARERLVQHRADGCVVVGDEDVALAHRHQVRTPIVVSLSDIGISARNTVQRGRESHSMMPP